MILSPRRRLISRPGSSSRTGGSSPGAERGSSPPRGAACRGSKSGQQSPRTTSRRRRDRGGPARRAQRQPAAEQSSAVQSCPDRPGYTHDIIEANTSDVISGCLCRGLCGVSARLGSVLQNIHPLLGVVQRNGNNPVDRELSLRRWTMTRTSQHATTSVKRGKEALAAAKHPLTHTIDPLACA